MQRHVQPPDATSGPDGTPGPANGAPHQDLHGADAAADGPRVPDAGASEAAWQAFRSTGAHRRQQTAEAVRGRAMADPAPELVGIPDPRDDPAFEPWEPAWDEPEDQAEQGAHISASPSGSTATPQHPPALAQEPDILACFADAVAEAGIAGERRIAQLLYLVLTSRLLERIVSLALKGPSASGKSYLAETVLGFFPPSAYYALSAMSERALVYDQEPLAHRILVIYEAAGLSGELASYIVRSLLSEGRIRYVTVEKTKAGLVPRHIDREGPTGLLVTTTAVKLLPENETRLLSVTVTDAPEQTKAVLLAQAAASGSGPDRGPWHALQAWLARGQGAVVVPYAHALAVAIPPVAVRLRRDFPAVLALIRAHALLHQLNRDRDEHGQIVATLADYGAVRELVADLVADAAEHSVPDTVRQTVEQVRELTHQGGETSLAKVARALGLDKSAASRRVRVAVERGYLRNLEEKRGRSARLVVGEPLPEEQPILPAPEVLQWCSDTAGGTRGADPSTEPSVEEDYPPSAWRPEPEDATA